MYVKSYYCNTPGCRNTAKGGHGRCTPCYRHMVATARYYESSSYSAPSSSGDMTTIITVVLLAMAAVLLYNVGMGAWHFINGVWHALPTVDEASMTCEVTGGLLGMVCSY